MRRTILHLVIGLQKKSAPLFLYLALGTLGLTLYPTAAFYAGNLFFGEIPVLYNLTFAKTFYKVATHPVLPPLTPWSAHYQLARTYFIEGDLFTSLDETQKELDLHPTNFISYYLMGLDYGYLGMFDEGIAAFSMYLRYQPESWAGRNDKAWLQFRIGDIDGALATVEPVIAKHPYSPWIQNTYCTLLINSKRREEAKRVCESVRELLSDYTPSDWGKAYPGNDPHVYQSGLSAMKKAVEENLRLLNSEK